MAWRWLDAARYADSDGYESDPLRNMWPWRDWVVEAFNSHMPYDQFIIEQLAGDQLENPSIRQMLATGFNRNHRQNNEGGIDPEEWIVEYVADRAETTATVFMGLTWQCARCHDHKYDPITMEDYYGLAGVFANIKMVNKTAAGEYEKSKTLAEKMRPATMHLVEESGSATNVNLFLRGDVTTPGPVVPRRFLRILSTGEPNPFENGSGRLELAESIATRDNPLTARVLVNRVWQALLGRGLVGTAGNFGQLGDRPTHPELLDDLAVRFMDKGWSVKWLARELVMSATYRQSSATRPEGVAKDEANRLYWRMNRRRMSIEQFRDAVLAVSGELDPAGGKSLELGDENNQRRTVYARVSRRELDKTMMLFDYPDANVHASARSSSTTAPQKLYVLNSPFVITRAKALAARLEAGAENDSDRIEAAFQMLYARRPSEAESALGLSFLAAADADGLTPWQQYAQALVAANEMMFID